MLKNIHLEGKVSHNVDIGLSFSFMSKNEKFCNFSTVIFLDFIKLKLGPKYKI